MATKRRDVKKNRTKRRGGLSAWDKPTPPTVVASPNLYRVPNTKKKPSSFFNYFKSDKKSPVAAPINAVASSPVNPPLFGNTPNLTSPIASNNMPSINAVNKLTVNNIIQTIETNKINKLDLKKIKNATEKKINSSYLSNSQVNQLKQQMRNKFMAKPNN